MTLRDGGNLCGYLSPGRGEGIPASVARGPFGKRAGGGDHEIPGIQKPSKMTMFEGPDPQYWCRHGYAVVNVDIRGIGNSQGDMQHWGSQDGKDGYDVVEWLAAREWCNGRIGFREFMAGHCPVVCAAKGRLIWLPLHPGKGNQTCIATAFPSAGLWRRDLRSEHIGKGWAELYRGCCQHDPQVSANERFWKIRYPLRTLMFRHMCSQLDQPHPYPWHFQGVL